MKKFLIGVVILIPIIVVVALLLTSSIIVAFKDNVYPASMQFKDVNTNEELETDDVMELWLQDEPFHFLIDIYPTIAFDRTATYKIDKIEGYDGDAELVHIVYDDESITNEYAIVPKKAGTVRLIIMANADVKIAKAITLRIKSDTMDSMQVVTADGTEVGDTLVLTEPTRLYCKVTPMESLSDVKWESDNTDYVQITDAGKVWPMGAGGTFIKVTAISLSGGEITKEIMIDTSAMLVRSTNVSTTKESVDEKWIRNYVLMEYKADVEQISATEFLISYEGATATVNVTCGVERGWNFASDTPKTIYTNRMPTLLDCEYNDFEEQIENCNISVSFVLDGNLNCATINDNIFTALNAGNVILRGTSSDGESHELEITVKECPLAFDLKLNQEDYDVGLAGERKWGIWFNNERNELVNTYQFGSSVDESKTEVLWESDDEALVISPERELMFAPEAAGKDITITAYIMAGAEKTGIKRSFTFSFVDDPNSVNVYTTEEFNKFNLSGRTIVLQPSIDPATNENAHIMLYAETYLVASLYGNGVVIDATGYKLLNADGSNASEYDVMDDSTTLLNVYPTKTPNAESYDLTKPTVISNIELVAANTFEESNNRGIAIYVRGCKCDVTIEYCKIHHFHAGIKTMHHVNECTTNDGNINIVGNYISDCYFAGILFASDPPISEYEIVIKDTVFSHFNGACIFICNSSLTDEVFYENIYPNISFEGRVEFYNWKSTEEIKNILKAMPIDGLDSLAKTIGSSSEQLMNAVGKVVQELFTREDMSYLTYTNPADGEKYVSMGMMALGTYCHSEAEAHTKIEDDSLKLLKLEIPTSGGIGSIIGIIEAVIQGMNAASGKESGKGMTITNQCYLICYDFTKSEPRVKPGETVPLNEELYAILRGEKQ